MIPPFPFQLLPVVNLTVSPVGFLGFSLLISLAKGPHEKGWFGWSGGWKMRAMHSKPGVDAPSSGESNQVGGDGADAEAVPGLRGNLPGYGTRGSTVVGEKDAR